MGVNIMDEKKPTKKEIVYYMIVPIICVLITAFVGYL